MELPVDFFRKLASAAAAETLPRFRSSTGVTNKAERGFDPVTEADRAAERAIRAILKETYPDHGIIGEEDGSENPDARHVWVIDPVDGTRAFISGLPLWGTLVGLKENGLAVAGMMAQPFTGELYYSDGTTSRMESCTNSSVLKTSNVTALEDATLMTTSPFLFESDIQGRYNELEEKAKLTRYGCDCYAYAMVAAGHVDMVCEAGLHPYDIVALIPIIEKAGGVVTTWEGNRAEGGGNILASANPSLHEKALSILAP